MSPSLSRHGLLFVALATIAWGDESSLESRVAELLAQPGPQLELTELALCEPRECTGALLARALDTTAPSEVRVRAIELLTLASTRDARPEMTLPELLDDPAPAVAAAAKRALTPGEPFEALARVVASRHPSSDVRLRALDELHQVETITPTLVSALDVTLDDPELRDAGLSLLIDVGGLATDPEALAAFGKLGASVFPRLGVEDREILLYALSPTPPGLLACAFADPHPAIRAIALSDAALGPARPELASHVLSALDDPDPAVRQSAMFVVREWDLPAGDALPKVLELVRTETDQPSSLQGFTNKQLAALTANDCVEAAAKNNEQPWDALLGAFWLELLSWLGGVLAWLAIVRRVPRGKLVGRWRAVQCAVALGVPIAATFGGAAWVAAELRDVAEVELFLPQPGYLVISPWLALQLTAAGVVALGALWALQRPSALAESASTAESD